MYNPLSKEICKDVLINPFILKNFNSYTVKINNIENTLLMLFENTYYRFFNLEIIIQEAHFKID